MRNCKSGELLTTDEKRYIATHYILSHHAMHRVEERLGEYHIPTLIFNSLLAYYNTDGTINIAVTDNSYFVFTTTGYMITFKEPSHNGITIHEKWELAKKGIGR